VLVSLLALLPLAASCLTNRQRRPFSRRGRLVCATLVGRRIFGSMELFQCPNTKCGARLTIIRRTTPPADPPKCEVCGQVFIRTESGHYLICQRADLVQGSEGPPRGGVCSVGSADVIRAGGGRAYRHHPDFRTIQLRKLRPRRLYSNSSHSHVVRLTPLPVRC
jgi:hypothetical protein